MARGTMYCITTDKDWEISFDESSYYHMLDAWSIDYVKNQDSQDSEIATEYLRKMLEEMGATTVFGHSLGRFAFGFRFEKLEAALQSYFKPRLTKLKRQVEALTLPDVIRSAPSLDFIMDNDYGDRIALTTPLGDFDLTVDDFIRRLEPGTTYYAYDRTILMH